MRSESVGGTGSWDYAQLDSVERDEIAYLLRSPYPHEWEAPSLCDRRRVREVVDHLISLGESIQRRFRSPYCVTDCQPNGGSASCDSARR